jgi:hypothetical protein
MLGHRANMYESAAYRKVMQTECPFGTEGNNDHNSFRADVTINYVF